MWSKEKGKSKEVRDDRGNKIFQILGGWLSQMGIFKYWDWKEEKKKEKDSTYGQTTKGAVRKKAGISHMGKSIGILWGEEYALQRHTSTREKNG